MNRVEKIRELLRMSQAQFQQIDPDACKIDPWFVISIRTKLVLEAFDRLISGEDKRFHVVNC